MSRNYHSILNVLSPSFTNTYSLAFDGVDDKITFSSISASDEFTVSLWLKPTAFNNNNKSYVFGIHNNNSNFLKLQSATGIQLYINYSFITLSNGGSGNDIVLNQWQNLILIRNSSNVVTAYLNGVAWSTVATVSSTLTINSIGRIINTSFGYAGGIDEFSFWQSDKTSDVATIYNSGIPADLSSLNPTLWLRNGDNGSFKSPQWLIPENSNKDKVSNYSFDFDGVDDYVIAPLDGTSTGGILAATYSDINLTISLWFKLNSAVNRQGIFQWGNELADATPFVSLQQWITSDRVRFYVDGAYQTMVNVNLGQWYNIILTRTASDNTYRGYLDGVEFFAYDDGGSITQAFWDSATDIYLSGGYFGGAACNVDEVAVWNSVQDVASIYNSGTPTTITGAVAHWKMGEEATFSTNWTVPDQVGSNDGTSANMTIEDRVGDAPNSTSNALSYNMTESDRKEDTPPTP